MQLSIYQWLKRLLVMHPDQSSSRIGSKPRGCDETSLFACDDHAIFSNVPGKAGVGHVMFLACFSLPSYRDGAAVRSGEPKSVSGNSVIRGTKQRELENFHTPMSVPHCHVVYILLDIHIFLIPPARAERCEFTAGAMERESLVFLGIHFIHFIIPSSMFIHISIATSSISVILILSSPGDKQPTPKWAGGAGSHGPWSAANTRVTSSDLTQLDASWCLMRIFAKTGLPNCLGSCAGCPCLSYLRAELEGSDWLTWSVESANIRSRRLWVLLNRIPLTLGIGML